MADQMKMSLADMLTMAQRWESAATKMRNQITQMMTDTQRSMGIAAQLSGTQVDADYVTGARMLKAVEGLSVVVQEMNSQVGLIQKIAADFAEKNREIAASGGDMMKD